jgi:hypothetical protein
LLIDPPLDIALPIDHAAADLGGSRAEALGAIARLDQEIARNKRLRQEAAEQLVTTFAAEGRPDLASFYTKPAETTLQAAYRRIRNG